MSHTWGRPASHQDRGWAVIDVETSGFRPGQARIISLAVLGLDAAGRLEQSVVSLLNPKVDPGPTHVHGLTAAMLDDQPQFACGWRHLPRIGVCPSNGRTMHSTTSGY